MRIVVGVVCGLVGVSPAWSSPCALQADRELSDLAPCLSEPARDADPAGSRHLQLDLSWAGPGTARRVLDLRIPDVLALEVTQQALNADGSDAATPAVVLQTLAATSTYEERRLRSRRVAVALELAPGRTRIDVDYRIHVNGRLYPRVLTDEAWRGSNEVDDVTAGLLWGLMLTLLAVMRVTRLLANEPAYRAYAALVLCHGLALAQLRGACSRSSGPAILSSTTGPRRSP